MVNIIMLLLIGLLFVLLGVFLIISAKPFAKYLIELDKYNNSKRQIDTREQRDKVKLIMHVLLGRQVHYYKDSDVYQLKPVLIFFGLLLIILGLLNFYFAFSVNK